MSGPLQRRTGQNSYPLLATQGLQHACMRSVNTHTHTDIHMYAYTAAVHTDILSCGSFDMSSIHLPWSGDGSSSCSLCLCCRQWLDGGYWSERKRERKRARDDRLSELVIEREMAGTNLIAGLCFLHCGYSDTGEENGPVDTLVWQRAFRCERASGRLALCSCWRTRQEQMGTKKKKRERDKGAPDKHSQEHKCTIYWNQYKAYHGILHCVRVRHTNMPH